MLEICVDSVESAMAAAQGGADRLELCAALSEGGLTPSVGLYRAVRAKTALPIMYMIRPRTADFLYSEAEFEAMQYDIETAKQLGADGVVLGILTDDGQIDVARTHQLVKQSYPLPVTFHRAFDMVENPDTALAILIDIGVKRILSSGQAIGVYEGKENLKKWIQKARDRIIIMPGAGILPANFAEIIATLGAKEYHAAALGWTDSKMLYRNAAPNMGAEEHAEYRWKSCDAAHVQELKAILDDC